MRFGAQVLILAGIILSIGGVFPAFRTGAFDFEKGAASLANWIASGDAFNNQPTYDDNPTARKRGQPSNHQGDYWIGGYENRPTPESQPGSTSGDHLQGTLRSPVFSITGPSVEFLIGGGCHIETIRVELVVNNQVVHKATGKCNETMERRHWDTACLIANNAYLRLVDHSSRGWGHINFDDFRGDIEFCEESLKAKQCYESGSFYFKSCQITGYLLRAITVDSELHCADKCFRSPHCDAYDFRSISGGKFQCKLITDPKRFENDAPEAPKAEGFSFRREHFHKVMFGNHN